MDDFTNKYMYAKEEEGSYIFMKVYKDNNCFERISTILKDYLRIPSVEYVQIINGNANISEIKWLGRVTLEDLRIFLKKKTSSIFTNDQKC